MLSLAADARRTAATLVHDTSSRSHAVLQLSICSSRRSGKEEEERGRFSFIDLAGTERGADTLNCVDRDRRIEVREMGQLPTLTRKKYPYQSPEKVSLPEPLIQPQP